MLCQPGHLADQSGQEIASPQRNEQNYNYTKVKKEWKTKHWMLKHAQYNSSY